MNEELTALEHEKEDLQKQLASVEAARDKFKSDPEFTYEFAKAEKDMQTLTGLIKEIDDKIAAGSNDEAPEGNFQTREGKVVALSEDDSQSQYRFAPDDAPDERRRLTTLSLQAAQPLDSREIDLTPKAGQRLRVRGNYHDAVWISQAKIL